MDMRVLSIFASEFITEWKWLKQRRKKKHENIKGNQDDI